MAQYITTDSGAVAPMTTPVIVSSNSGSSGIAGWVALILVIILIILFIFFFFFSGSSITQTNEFFGANYVYADNTRTVVPTAGNFIYIIPNTTPTGSSVTITSNNLNQPGRTFLIKNDSPNPVTINADTNVTLFNLAGASVRTDTLAPTELAEYISNSVNPGTEFRRLL